MIQFQIGPINLKNLIKNVLKTSMRLLTDLKEFFILKNTSC